MTQPTARQILASNIADARQTLAGLEPLGGAVGQAAALIHQSLISGGKLLCCGNGGSACDSAHFAAEIVGRFVRERRGWPAIDMTADHGLVTALINDYPPEQVFARQINALGVPGDVLAVFTTSGKSKNIVAALTAAKAKGLKTVAFLGRDGGTCKGMADVELIVPAKTTVRIQEAHLVLYHTVCEILDPLLDT